MRVARASARESERSTYLLERSLGKWRLSCVVRVTLLSLACGKIGSVMMEVSHHDTLHKALSRFESRGRSRKKKCPCV